jgi:hypothetical protein
MEFNPKEVVKMSNDLAVREDFMMQDTNVGIIPDETFCMTIEQAKMQIGRELQMYALFREVAAKLLTEKDKYYMSQLNNKYWKEPKKDEAPVLKKQAVDKLISFFKIQLFPSEEKIDGGYQVTVVAKDSRGRYIGTGRGICTRYEKKYSWVKASDDEYVSANESDRRVVEKKYDNKPYEVKQIKTDERGIAHTLSSMAEKRARAAFLRKLMPDLDDVCFEGEALESDFHYDNQEPPSSGDKTMSDTEITAFYTQLKSKYKVADIKEAFRAITKSEKLGGMTVEQSLNITTYMFDNFGGELNGKD